MGIGIYVVSICISFHQGTPTSQNSRTKETHKIDSCLREHKTATMTHIDALTCSVTPGTTACGERSVLIQVVSEERSVLNCGFHWRFPDKTSISESEPCHKNDRHNLVSHCKKMLCYHSHLSWWSSHPSV